MRATILALMVLWPVPLATQHPHNIPDFCLGSPDTVKAGQTLAVSAATSKGCVRVESGGALRILSNGKLTADMVFVLPGGLLELGTAAAPIQNAEIVIRDGPFQADDPEQFGRGIVVLGTARMHGLPKTSFVRAAATMQAGQTALPVQVSGWLAGDRIAIPDTRMPVRDGTWTAQQVEVETLASATTITAPLNFTHVGLDGFQPHVGNLTRSVTVRSENPNGTRGHFLATDRADVDIRYVAFLDLGRTRVADPPGVGNQLGRYPLHIHHLIGPTTPQANGRQFTLIGNAIENGSKWGVTVHGSHYGLVQDNVVFNTGGAGIMTEDGSETGNVIDRNFVLKPFGPTGDANNEFMGREQSGIWLRGPMNVVTNNIAANVNGNTFVYFNGSSASGQGSIVSIPPAQGQPSSVVTDISKVPIREDRGNEGYASMFGWIGWDVMASCCTEVHEGPESTVRDLKLWRIENYGAFPYGTNRLTFDGAVMVNDLQSLIDAARTGCFTFGDYLTRNFTVRNMRCEHFMNGIHIPIKAGDTRDIYGNTPGSVLLDRVTFRNMRNLLVTLPYGVSGGGDALPGRLIDIRDSVFALPNVPNAAMHHVEYEYDIDQGPNVNAVASLRIVFTNFNTTPGDSFEVFGPEQAATFIAPQTGSRPGLVGVPEAGLTNQQAQAKYGTSVYDHVAPCTTVVAGFEGFRCGLTSTPPPDPPQTGGPSQSAITQIGSVSTNPSGQQLWQFQSVESPNWETALWGTATHKFNVVVVNGSGALPVFLQLHSAGNNGPHDPETSVNTTTPGIYVLPVDLGYLGIPDPVTGRGRFYSKWMGYKDAQGIYQPVTADRVVRYVQWVLTQSSKWNADPNRVYLKGASMGGGGAMHVGALYPAVFAAIVSSIGWIDIPSWADGLDDCLPGVRWKTATGQLCRDVVDMVKRVQTWQGPRTPLYLTWNSNDDVIDPRRYPELLSALEAARHGYQAEWRADGHSDFGLAGEPNLKASFTSPPPVGTPTGSSPTNATGTRTNFGSGLPTDPDTDGDGVKDSLDKCPGTPAGTPVDAAGCPVSQQPATITVNSSVRHQVMHHWEAGVLASIEDYASLTDAQIGAMLDLAVTDMGITRVRLAIRSGTEGPGNRYEIVNDNADPNVINDAGFTWATFDTEVSRWVVPARQRALARGETLYVSLGYSDFGQSAFEHYNSPAEYAEFMLAAFRHMQSQFGFMPNGIDLINEPDNTGGAWTGDRIGACMVAVAQRFQKEGLPVPEFTSPSVTAMPNADGFLNDIYAVVGAKPLLSEVAYHRYNMAGDLAALAARAQADGKRMAMTEFWSPSTDHTLLYQDVTEGRNSAWHLGAFGDAYGCQFGQTIGLINGVAQICPKNWTVRQYTKVVRPGALRLEATTTNAALKPLAFVNTNGAYVVVVWADAPASFGIGGLPAGTYGVFHTTPDEVDKHSFDRTIAAGDTLTAAIPRDGVITIYGKTAGPPPSPDSDQDGVPDTADKCPSTPAGTKVDASGCPIVTPPGQAVLTYLGPIDDKVSEGTVLKPNTIKDGVFSLTLPESRTVTKVCLSGPGTWCTAPTTNWWVGVALTPGGPLVNDAAGAVNVQTQSLVLYADPGASYPFTPGNTYTATVTTTIGTLTGSVTIASTPQADADNDKVPDSSDKCPNTPAGATVDANGCAASQRDTDGDQVTDDLDKCPGTPAGSTVNAEGCPVVPVPSAFTVTATITTCTYVARDVPPTVASDWAVQFQRRNGNAGAWVNHGSRDSTAPYERSAVLPFAPWEYQAIWTRTGSAPVTRLVQVPGCPK